MCFFWGRPDDGSCGDETWRGSAIDRDLFGNRSTGSGYCPLQFNNVILQSSKANNNMHLSFGDYMSFSKNFGSTYYYSGQVSGCINS